VKGVRLYVEGGGGRAGRSKGGRDGRAQLRRGLNEFLAGIKRTARARQLKWNVVCCDPRDDACRRFVEAARAGSKEIVLLLVDSEDEVKQGPRRHLMARDGWTRLRGLEEAGIHLMVRAMETWLVADLEALRSYYGRQFNDKALAGRQDLEQVPKRRIETALVRATRATQKGEYHKIRHASDLLALVDPEKVQARCPHCKRFFDTLTALIEEAA